MASALGFALNSALDAVKLRADNVGIFASPGHSRALYANRGGLRAEHARQQVPGVSACILVTADPVACDVGGWHRLVEWRRPRALDPVQIDSGRSPPLAPSPIRLLSI